MKIPYGYGHLTGTLYRFSPKEKKFVLAMNDIESQGEVQEKALYWLKWNGGSRNGGTLMSFFLYPNGCANLARLAEKTIGSFHDLAHSQGIDNLGCSGWRELKEAN